VPKAEIARDTAILAFAKTGVGGTDHVWFYDVQADGWSLDDKRQELLPAEKLGPTPAEKLSTDEATKNNLPDVASRWKKREAGETKRPRTAQSFCVPKAEIARDGAYDLSLNRYKEIEHEELVHESPATIIAELKRLETEISDGLQQLEEMVA
jgi:type I restriction enzyme M protein